MPHRAPPGPCMQYGMPVSRAVGLVSHSGQFWGSTLGLYWARSHEVSKWRPFLWACFKQMAPNGLRRAPVSNNKRNA
eukprot:3783231-Alexandrium_andersonii.AAC.1